jgi:hypothetical protein
MAKPLNVIIIERTGEMKSLAIKDFKEEELYKKCGFKKADDFIKQYEWGVKYPSGSSGIKYYVQAFAKTDGRANSENKYDFPPPIDNKLFFGCCALIAYVKLDDGTKKYTDLTKELWDKIYEKLFGGFEDLVSCSKEDEEEEDELVKIPKEKKTKHGYLKDGFVVDSSETEDEDYESECLDDDEDELKSDEKEETEQEDGTVLEDIGSELSEEEYV